MVIILKKTYLIVFAYFNLTLKTLIIPIYKLINLSLNGWMNYVKFTIISTSNVFPVRQGIILEMLNVTVMVSMLILRML